MFPVVTALLGAEEILGKDRKWSSLSETQERFLQEVFDLSVKDARNLKEIETKVSWEAAALNQFLKEKGFSIELDEFGDGEFGVASVLDLLMKWLEPGKKVSLKRYSSDVDDDYPAVRLEGPCTKTLVDRNQTFGDHEVLFIKTTGGDKVYIAMSENPPEGLDLVRAVRQVMSTPLIELGRHEGAVIPMIDMNVEDDLSWLIGMQTHDEGGQPWYISQAKQQTKLRLNEKGARAQSAVAIGCECLGMPPPPFVVDKPFVFWVMRDGIDMPLFVSYITPEHWKEPADLETP